MLSTARNTDSLKRMDRFDRGGRGKPSSLTWTFAIGDTLWRCCGLARRPEQTRLRTVQRKGARRRRTVVMVKLSWGYAPVTDIPAVTLYSLLLDTDFAL
ncbi:hypothetical protein WN55_04304 [Dufourea novaeangliae]|uniref:Uncharacterized protein n=1 Tax=Dufourea novaeangliae TaxID=178035 RepID=A0A154PLQ3_DUFNO|nr:hypothetical protein WN55_04304 [Dufourea novaeangliae]